MIVPPTAHTSRTSRELTSAIDGAIRKFRIDNPRTSDADVQMSLQSLLQHGTGQRSLPARVGVAVLGMFVALGVGAVMSAREHGAGMPSTWMLAAFFLVVVMLAVFVMARRHG